MLSNLTQIIIFDKEGSIVESNDTLFNSNEIGATPVYLYFPLIESIFHLLFKKDIDFQGVEVENKLLAGVYDYSFRAIPKDNSNYIEWTIEDRTNEYNHKRIQQQERQENIIRQQQKDYRNVYEK